jgi:hypothetical protein
MKTKQSLCSLKDLWGVRVPLRVGVFKWLPFRNSILTKYNLLKRGWVVTRVNSANVLDEGLMIRGRATTRDSGSEIGT